MSFIDTTPGQREREEKRREREATFKSAEAQKIAGEAVVLLITRLEESREAVDEMVTQAFIARTSPTQVFIDLLKTTLESV